MRDKKKILFVGTSIVGGGAERVFINIINSIDISRFDIEIVLTCQPEKTDLRTDVPVIYYGVSHMRQGLMKLIAEIRRFRPDYVFTSDGTIAWTLPIVRSISQCSFKIVTRVAVTPSEKFAINHKSALQEKLSARFYRKMDMVIAQTQFMKSDLIRNYHIEDDKISVIRNLIDFKRVDALAMEFEPLEIIPGKYNIVASGALYSVKGFDLLIEAVSAIVSKIPGLSLLILGDERYEHGYKSFLNRKISELGLSNNVRLLGHKVNPYPYYKYANLFVLSSRKEGFPNVVLESLSLGTPVVCTDCVDFSGIVDDANGVVVAKNSDRALAEGILKAATAITKPVKFNYRNFDYNMLFQ